MVMFLYNYSGPLDDQWFAAGVNLNMSVSSAILITGFGMLYK